MKKNLLVTLADKNYLVHAKQLFSAAYFNAGWQGDYMVIVPDEDKNDPGLEWFQSKGILVNKLPSFYQGQVGGMEAIRIIKFHLFTSEFKKWEHVIYVDVDTLIRASLDELIKVKGLAAVKELGVLNLSSQFTSQKNIEEKTSPIFRELRKEFNLKTSMFNTGILVINTNLINADTSNKLNQLFNKYQEVMTGSDQAAFNLMFYKRWQKLSPIYNSRYLSGSLNWWHIKLEKIKGIIIHFPGKDKPWLSSNYFYQEWKANLDKADKIDLNNIPKGNNWTKWQARNYSMYLSFRYIFVYVYYFIDIKVGKIGIVLKKYSPRLYWALKRLKG